MQERARQMIEIARAGAGSLLAREVGETVDVPRVAPRSSTSSCSGYREYDLVDTPKGRALRRSAEQSGLGILSNVERLRVREARAARRTSSRPSARRIEDGDLLIYSKTNRSSTVHRRARMDYIGVRKVDAGRLASSARPA